MTMVSELFLTVLETQPGLQLLCFTKITVPPLLSFLFLLFFSALSSLLLQVAVLLLVSVDAAR